MLEPSNPDTFDGRHNAVMVSTCLYKVEVYLNLMQVSNPEVTLTDSMKIRFASLMMKGTAANWCYMLAQSDQDIAD